MTAFGHPFKQSASDTRLVTATGSGLVADNRLAVSPERLAEESPGVLQLPGADGGSARSVAVRLVPAAGVPADVVVVPAVLVQEHRVLPDENWKLAAADARIPAVLELELPPGPSLDEAATMLKGAPLLCGHVFEQGHDTAPEAWIDVAGTLFRVRQCLDHGGQVLRGLLQVAQETRIVLFAPGERSGVDIVVLADCSASMSIEDIPAAARDGGGWLTRLRPGAADATVSRMNALKEALRSMIDARMRYDGVGTRFALVRFDHDNESAFPSRWGMEEVSDARSVQQLREAVSLLKFNANSGTDIGKALHRAGELLHRYGVPGNERLVVLVSDGANWAPLPDERSGESLSGTQDPVSLMEDLHAGLDIRLHTVGISDEKLFDRWWQAQRDHPNWRPQAHPSMIPNHQMLGELATVAGGDRQRVGGLEVLEQYFAELGDGVAREVGRPLRPRLPALQLSAEQLAAEGRRRAGADPRQRREWRVLVEAALNAHSMVCRASEARLGKPLFGAARPHEITRLHEQCDNLAGFTAWLAEAYKIFNERLDDSLRRPFDRTGNPRNPEELPLPQLAVPFWNPRMSQLHELRNYFLHDRDQKEYTNQNRNAGEVIRRHTGKYAPHDDDTEAWRTLQLGLLRDLAALLREAHTILDEAVAAERVTEERVTEEPLLMSQGWE
ncbi:von Willebrand factor type A [Actinobacteria bacterium OK074]|nr:von Willebrand factor type A [Actinobacteria bacterium OK074]